MVYLLIVYIYRSVTARTNASEMELERMLYYEDTKLGRRKRGVLVRHIARVYSREQASRA